MAGLDPGLAGHRGARLSWAQFRAIAWLRWRIFANAFRRKGGAAELIGRILLLPLFFVLALMPTAMAGFFAWYIASSSTWGRLGLLFWGIVALTQLLNLNLGQPGTTFDPIELIRFPMALRHYVLVRLGFGLLSPANVLVLLMSAATCIGLVLGRPSLWPWAVLATAAFALANVLFSRMIFAWVDRWLSTRRAREIFTGFIFVGSLLFQYLNVTYNPGFQHGRHSQQMSARKLVHAQHVYGEIRSSLAWLPPELASTAVEAGPRHKTAQGIADLAGICGYAVVFLAVYTLRMRSEYRGENLSDQANAVRATPRMVPAHAAALPLAASPALTEAQSFTATRRGSLLPVLLGKEILVLRRNTGLLYGVIAPTVMVFLFAGRLSLRGGSHWLLLLAVAYALLGLAPMSYNSFGLEGPGAQLYFMAPVPLRDVFFAKNLMQFLLALFEVIAVIAIVAYVTGRLQLADVVFALLWAAGALLLNTALGNLRSVSAPKKVNPGRSMNRAQSQVSAWIAIGVLVGCASLGAGVQLLATLLGLPWVALLGVALFAAGALVAYGQGLRNIERYALERRESLFEELGRKT